jgi:hypothetical protein
MTDDNNDDNDDKLALFYIVSVVLKYDNFRCTYHIALSGDMRNEY